MFFTSLTPPRSEIRHSRPSNTLTSWLFNFRRLAGIAAGGRRRCRVWNARRGYVSGEARLILEARQRYVNVYGQSCACARLAPDGMGRYSENMKYATGAPTADGLVTDMMTTIMITKRLPVRAVGSA